DVERALPRQDGGRIVAILQQLAAALEARGEIDRAIIRHHEALVYQDVRHAPDQYARTLYTLGRLYTQVKRYNEAAKALEDALATDYSQTTPDQAAIDAGTKLLADVYRAQNRLEQAAELYRRIAAPESESPPDPDVTIVHNSTLPDNIRAAAVRALEGTQREIERYRQTLQTAEQSWVLLNRNPQPELKSLAFIRALQAQMYAALGEWDESERSLTQMIELLAARRAELETEANGPRPSPAIRALALLLAGQDHEDRREYDQALESYQQALALAEQRKLAAELVWVLRQKMGKQPQRSSHSTEQSLK
ncbi:MAG: tetratricopeptide repeat protein, partial [Aggregatilineales bacterium]